MKYPGTTTSTSKVHINNVYIKYTFLDVTSLQICQVLGAVALPVSIALAVEAHSVRLRPSLGFLWRSSNLFATLLEVTLLLRLAFLDTSGLVDHQHLMLLFDFHFSSFKH